MLDLQRLPLADPLADSLGRPFGQYPALTYVNCTNNVRVPLLIAHFAAKPVPDRAVVRVGAARRSSLEIRRVKSNHWAAGMACCRSS
jgi:hypothetical protein